MQTSKEMQMILFEIKLFVVIARRIIIDFLPILNPLFNPLLLNSEYNIAYDIK